LLGRLDPDLDSLGVRQATALAAALGAEGPVRVVASPLARARQTAEALGVPVEYDSRWIEIDYGVYDGLALDQVPGSLWSSWAADPEWAPEGGESLAAVGRRVHAACEELWEQAAGENVVVVTHVSPIKAAVAWALGLGPAAQLRSFIQVASLHRIGPGRDGPALWSLNEVAHRPSR
jgi:broad specificity phosphatase PhoE